MWGRIFRSEMRRRALVDVLGFTFVKKKNRVRGHTKWCWSPIQEDPKQHNEIAIQQGQHHDFLL